jgi:hypothetical protein
MLRFISPSNRVEVTVLEDAQLGQHDVDWLAALRDSINRRLAEVAARPMPTQRRMKESIAGYVPK